MIGNVLRAVVFAVSWALCGAAALSCCGAWSPTLDLLSHFRIYYAAIAIVALVLLVGEIARRRRVARITGVLLAAVLLGNGYAVAQLYVGREAVAATGPTLRIVHFNVYHGNRDADGVLRCVTAQRPDVVSLQEVTTVIVERFAAAGWRLAITDVRMHDADDSGCALFLRGDSSVELVATRTVKPFGSRGQTFLGATFRFAGRDFETIAAHVPPPNHPRNRARRPRYLEALVRFLASSPSDVVFAGDLNTTSFGAEWNHVLAAADLRSAAEGFGYQPTWPATGWRRPLGIPIDHVLHSSGFVATRYEVLDDRAGSDHWPVSVDLALRGDAR